MLNSKFQTILSLFPHLFIFVSVIHCTPEIFLFDPLVSPHFVDFPEDTQVVEGNAVMLKCSSQGVPKPRIIWRKNGHRLPPSNRIWMLRSGALQISEARRRDHGRYTCRAENKVGYVTRTAILVITRRLVGVHSGYMVLVSGSQNGQCNAEMLPAGKLC